MSDDKSPHSKPLNCPKGYGLCWTCERWCDLPQDMAGNVFVPSRATSSPYDLNGLKEYPGE